MSLHETDPSSIENRLARLEKRLRIYNSIGVAFLGIAVVVVASGQYRAPQVVRAPGFEITNSQGRTVGAFGLSKTGRAGLWVTGVAGQNGLFQVLGTDGQTVWLHDKPAHEKPAAVRKEMHEEQDEEPVPEGKSL